MAPVQALRGEAAVGLPALVGHALPRGYREYRLELGCGACLPVFLVRLREHEGRSVIGEAYLLWFDPSDVPPGDTTEAARPMRATPRECSEPLRPSAIPRGERPFSTNSWCPVRLAAGVTWSDVLLRLRELRVLELGSEAGYAPSPPGRANSTQDASGRITIRGSGCQDIGGGSLTITSLDGESYRLASFWCLEREAPEGSEHARVAEAQRFLDEVLGRT